MDDEIKKYNQKLLALKAIAKAQLPGRDIDKMFDDKYFKLSNAKFAKAETVKLAKVMLKELESIEHASKDVFVTCDFVRWTDVVNTSRDACLRHIKNIQDEKNVEQLKAFTHEYINSHKKNALSKISLFARTSSNNSLRRVKTNLFVSLSRTLIQKNKSSAELIEGFKSKLNLIEKDPKLDLHRDPTWRRYLKNVAGVLCFGAAPIYSKVKFGTFRFWLCESRRTIDQIQGEIKRISSASAR